MSKYLYDVKNIRTGITFATEKTSAEVSELTGIKADHVCRYAQTGSAYMGKYKVTRNLTQMVSDVRPSEWMKEWDKARMKLLRAYGKGYGKGRCGKCREA